MSRKKNPGRRNKKDLQRRPKGKFLIPGLVILAVLIVLYFVTFGGGDQAVESDPVDIELGGFQKEGTLTFIDSNGGEIVTIDIEIADEMGEQQAGLMYREKLGRRQGMLFIYDPARFQVFWMKNTLIPLDIIFADKERRIINIHEYTIPNSESRYASEGVSRYVVEVNAGFTEEHGIEAGDLITYTRR